MKSLADGLPPEIAAQIHPEWRQNERDYWAARDGHLAEYAGQWVAFAGGRVVASGRSPVAVCHAAREFSTHAFSTCVGQEGEGANPRRYKILTPRQP